MRPSAPRAKPPVARIPCIVEAAPGHPLIDFVFAFRGGSSTDPAGLEGRLSLTLGTMLRGSRTHSGLALEDAFDRLGAEVDIEVDADGSRIQASVLPRNAEKLFALIAECVVEPRFSQREIGRQRRAMVADLVDARNDDDDLAARAFCRALFVGHPYGRPAHGTMDSLARVKHADLVEAHRDVLVRRDLVVGASGAIDERTCRAWIDRYLGNLADGPSRAAFPAVKRVVRGRHLVLIDKPERTRHAVCVGGLGTLPSDADHHALVVANAAFGGMYTARMLQELRVKRGWSYDAHSSLGRGRARQSFAMVAMPSSPDLAPTLTLLCELLEVWIDRGLSEREVALAKDFTAASLAFELDTPVKRLEQRLLAPLWGLPRDHHITFADRIRSVSRAQANAAIRHRIAADDLVLGVVASAAAHRDELSCAIPRMASMTVHRYDRELPLWNAADG